MKFKSLKYACLAAALWAGTAWPAAQEDFQQGRQLYLKGDLVTAMPILKRAADAGHAGAQSLYGYILNKSEYTDDAVLYFRRAAEQGDADGQYGLGALYASGEGVSRDPVAARQWLERAGAQRHPQAVIVLSQAFLGSSLGFRRDPADAGGLAWVAMAAELGSIPALDYLAKGYRSGAFGAPDVALAERMEARIRELTPDLRKKGRGKK
jgi:hypothetical protein